MQQPHDRLRVLQGPGQHEMAHYHTADQALLAAILVVARLARLLHHGGKGRQRHLGVVGRTGVAARERGIGVLEVGEISVYEAPVRTHGLHRLVAARIPQHGQPHAGLPCQRHGFANLRPIVGGGHAVDVQGPGSLELAHDGRQAFHGDRAGVLAESDVGVLAVHAAQGAAGEEHRAAAVLAGNRRLLPKVQRRPRHHQALVGPAESALPRCAVRPTAPRALTAGMRQLAADRFQFLHLKPLDLRSKRREIDILESSA